MTIVDMEDLRRRRCEQCGAVVWDAQGHEAWHTAWHQAMDKMVAALGAVAEAGIQAERVQEQRWDAQRARLEAQDG